MPVDSLYLCFFFFGWVELICQSAVLLFFDYVFLIKWNLIWDYIICSLFSLRSFVWWVLLVVVALMRCAAVPTLSTTIHTAYSYFNRNCELNPNRMYYFVLIDIW